QLAATDEETLRSAARLGYRAPYVLELARSVAPGTLRLRPSTLRQSSGLASLKTSSGQALDLEGFKTADIPTPQLRK
ncbi:MAG: hypothetical protein GTO63_36055, partial [Anaerolineae bacterium]|nr:hypothetical protein [Anaerolineae bacterium]NIQ82949.1 hypothetical protein [Anaerolineae bacterium]